MALRNLYNSQNSSFTLDDIEITHAMTLKEENYSIRHELNPTTGDYTIKDKNNNKLFHMDKFGALKPSYLHAHIQTKVQTKVQEVKDVTDAHDTTLSSHTASITSHTSTLSDHSASISRLSGTVANHTSTIAGIGATVTNHSSRIINLENSITGGGAIGRIDQVLGIGHDADGQQIIGLSNVSTNTVTVGGDVVLSSDGGVLVTDANLFCPRIDTLSLGVGAGQIYMGSNEQGVLLNITSETNAIYSTSGAVLSGFSNVLCDKLTVNNIELTNVDSVLTCGNDFEAVTINCGTLNCKAEGSDIELGKFGGDIVLKIDSHNNRIISESNAQLVGFQPLNDMAGQIADLQDRCSALESYNLKLKKLISSISLSLSLKDPDTGDDFDFTDLI